MYNTISKTGVKMNYILTICSICRGYGALTSNGFVNIFVLITYWATAR